MKSIYKKLSKKVLLVTLIAHLSVFSFAATYYVSNSGNDANSGLTTSAPWKSLEKVNSFAFKAGDQILFERGSSFYGTLTVNYSGAVGSPIVYSTYGTGANPIITGFTQVTAWTNLGSNIWESTNAVSTLSSLNMVVIGGVNTAMGREPDAGYYYFQSHSDNYHITSSDLSGTPNWTGAELALNVTRYQTYRCQITEQSSGTLTFTQPEAFSLYNNGLKFIIQNDIRTLDTQNEWYYNPSTKKISVYSRSQPTNVKVSTIDNLVALASKNYVTFQNVDFEGANTKGFSLSSCNYINIKDCNISNIGWYGAYGGYSTSSYVSFENCSFSNCNNNAIGFTSYFTYVTVDGCTIDKTGMIYGATRYVYSSQNDSGIGIGVSVAGSNSTLQNNVVTNSGYVGIRYLGNNVTVQNNYIYKFCQNQHDGGGLYTWNGSNTSYSGTQVLNNVVINELVNTDETDGKSGKYDACIYLDNYSNGITISGNTMSSSGIGLFLINSHEVIATNNTLFNNDIGIRYYTLSGSSMANISVSGNKIVAKKAEQNCVYGDEIEDIKPYLSASSNVYARPIDDRLSFTLVDRSSSKAVTYSYDLEQWKSYSKQDVDSKKSPQLITSESDLQFEYNTTQTAKTVTLSQPMIDVTGMKYAKSIVLQPFTSIVLMKDNNPVILPTVYNTEYVSICDGTNYNGWTITGKYSRTLIAESGADSIVTTYLTVNPKFTVTEDITINKGESYQDSTVSCQFIRTLSSVSGCDSTVITNLTVLENSGKLGIIQPTHFIPVWQGDTGYNLMNFVVNSATLEDMPLQADDEIGVFSQGVCVGSVRLTQAVTATDQSTYLSFVASQNTGSNNGYTSGETVVFKIWDNSTQTEWTVNKVAYQAGSAPVITSGLFTPQATAIASLESYQVLTQTISFKKGNNLFSTYLIPENADMAAVMEPLCKSGALYKIQDEAGRSFEYWGSYGGWVNKIGSITSTEGYNVNVNFDCTLQITGRQKVVLPLTIPLRRGWNFISFPHESLINAMTVVQPLIDQKKLSKVQDESGNSIENLKGYGWVNNIGNFVPGKAYKIYASSAASLVIQSTYTKSILINTELLATEFFKPVYEGNGVNHMNINLVDLALLNAQAGDEIAAFDGELCVGALKLSADNLNAGFASVVASYNTKENTRDGFTDSNPVSLVLWKSGSGEKVELTNLNVIDGQTLFARNSSVLLGGQQLTTGNELTLGNDETTVSVFPNPCKGNFSVHIQTGSSWAEGKIEIFDFTGKLIERRNITENTETFSVNNKPSGMYFVKTTSGLTQHTNKLVVNN